jgi:hypothetical protein
VLQPAHGVGHFLGSHLFHPVPHRRQHRNRRQPGDPVPVLDDFVLDQLLRRRQLGMTSLEIRRDDGLEIVQVVEEYVAQLAHGRVDVTRKRNVQDAQRAIAARRECRLDVIDEYNGMRSRGRAHEHVDVGQRRPALLVVHRDRAIARGELHRAFVRAVRDDRGANALIVEALERELGHLTCPEHHRAFAAESPEDLLRELDGRRAHGGSAARH